IPETEPDLDSVRVWIGAGSNDPIVPASETKELAELLRGAGADVTIRFFEGGHQLTQQDIHAAHEWLRAQGFQMTPDEHGDAQFYRDTESVAFPKLADRQLSLLEPRA